MNWECSLLNKIYKTMEFKPKTKNLLDLQQQKELRKDNKKENLSIIINKNDHQNKNKKEKLFPKTISSFIEMFQLSYAKIKSSKKGAIYMVKSDKNCQYFDYFTNLMFYQFCNFFILDEKYISNEDLSTINNIFLNILINNKIEYKGLEKNAFYYYIFVMFFNKDDKNLSEFFFNIINDFLESRVYVNNNQPTSHDIVILSTFFNSALYKEKQSYFLKFKNIERWFTLLKCKLEINFEKIETTFQSYFNDIVGDSYKFNSSQELVQAVQRTDIDRIKTLLQQQENVDSRQAKDFKSLGHIACRNGNIDILKILIEYGCNLESLDFEHMTPLFDAIYSGNIELCEYLIEDKKVNINHVECQDRNIFYWACCTGDLNIVDYLQTKKNLSFNQASKMGRTPLSKACWNGQIDIVLRLLKIPDLNINSYDTNERTPLHNAAWGENGGRIGKKGISNKDSPECTQALIEAGANVECLDKEKYTPLMLAASTKGIESLKLLILYGANVNHTNIYNATPLIEAARYGNTESVVTLIELGKDLNYLHKDINNMNVYEYCAVEDVSDCLEILLNAHMLGIDDLFSVLDYSIYLKSKNTFNITIKTIKTFINNNDKHTREKFSLALEKMINLFRFSFFFSILNDKQIVSIYENNIFSELIMIKLIVMIEIIFKQTDEKNNNSKSYDSGLNSVYENITKKDKISLKENRDKILNDYYEILNKNNDQIPLSFMKTLLFFDFKEMFFLCYDHNLKLGYPIDEKEISIDKNNYLLKIPKNKKIEVHNLLVFWTETINNINKNNIFFLSLLNSDEEYFNRVLKINCLEKYFFAKNKENENFLHILFSIDNLNKFKMVLSKFEKICEKNNLNKFDKLNQLLNECDSNLLLPIDTSLKKGNYNVIEEYSMYMKKNFQDKIININDSTYKLLNLSILETKEINVPEENMNINKKVLLILGDLLETKSLTRNQIFYPFKTLLLDDKFALINTIVSKIDENIVYTDFHLSSPQYNYEMIDTEDKLIECKEHLIQYNIIGVDLEHYGENDKYGIACTLQISTINKSFVIDCLFLRTQINKYLKDIFENDLILKIFHGCDNDIKWLLCNFNIIPINIFDTAKAFVYFQKFILNKEYNSNYPSLFYLVKFFLDFKIDKSYQKADWRLRPLTSSKDINKIDMLQYALNDSKLIIYIFFLMIGLFYYLNKWNDHFNLKNVEIDKFYFERLIKKFLVDNDKLDKSKEKKLTNHDVQYIFIKTYEECIKTVNLKLLDKNFYNLLMIKNN